MKIMSHSIEMQSQHFESQIRQEPKLSFDTLLYQQPENIEEIPISQQEIKQHNENFDILSRLHAIIEHLFASVRNSIKPSQTMLMQNKERTTLMSRISLEESYAESEKVEFKTEGKIQTDSGSLDINMNFAMSRSFMYKNEIDIYSTFDPLIINLDGEMPELSSNTFSFDLDNDGKSDQVSKLKGNSGFLALDKNADGIVNSGSELFGTLSGDGFEELAEYDKDKNGWIDENDSIFDKLQIWFNNKDTQEKQLVAIGEVGIGAIYLNSVSSEFSYKNEQNKVLGELKSSGIFLEVPLTKFG